MDYKYEETRRNSDDTFSYNIIGVFPVKFSDFFRWVLKHDTSFSIKFGASNECYGGWLGNRLKVYNGVCLWDKQRPANWYNEIADKRITKCWANGGWGQMLYVCTFEE